MNRDEKIAYNYLKHLGFLNIIFEPDGNVPPDFLIDNSIAVEVRRLNQHKEEYKINKPLEKLEYQLVPRIEKIIEELEIDDFNKSILVSVSFKRPIIINKKLFKQIKTELIKHIPLEQKEEILKVNYNLEIRLCQLDTKLDKSILLSSINDMDAGGWVISEVYRNLKLVLDEKERKIHDFYKKYDMWWFILVDHIGYGLDNYDIEQFNNAPRLITIFNKIIIISPLDIKRANDIKIENVCF